MTTADDDEWALRAQQAAMDRDEQALRADAAERRAEEAEALARDLRGAMDADDNRLRAASERVFGDYAFGCDTAMWLADEVLGLRQRLASERAAREKAEREAQTWRELCDHRASDILDQEARAARLLEENERLRYGR